MTYRLPIVHAHLCGTNHKVLTMEKQVPDMSLFDSEEVPVNEGQTHPKDRPGGGSVIAGWVRYESNADTSS